MPPQDTTTTDSSASSTSTSDLCRLEAGLRRFSRLSWLLLASLWLLAVVLFSACVRYATWVLAFGSGRNPDGLEVIAVGCLGVALVFALYELGSCLWVDCQLPTGVAATAGDAPILWEVVTAECRAAAVRPIRHIRLTTDVRFELVDRGLFGWWGPSQRCLLLGLPLLAQIRPEEFRNALRWRLVKSQMRAKFGIPETLEVWRNLWHYLQRSNLDLGATTAPSASSADIFLPRCAHRQMSITSRPGILLSAFCDWFVPRLLVMADTFEQRVVSATDALVAASEPDLFARSLLTIFLKRRLFHRQVWPELMSEATHIPELPADLPGVLANRSHNRPARDEGIAWLLEAFSDQKSFSDQESTAGDDDSALSLGQRILSLPGFSATQPQDWGAFWHFEAGEPTAEQVLLSRNVDAFRGFLDAVWRYHLARPWARVFRQAERLRLMLAEFDTQLSQEYLTQEEGIGILETIFSRFSYRETAPRLSVFLDRFPSSPRGLYLLARILLQQRDETGLVVLEQIMYTAPALLGEIIELLENYAKRTGSARQQAFYRACHVALQRVWEHAEREDQSPASVIATVPAAKTVGSAIPQPATLSIHSLGDTLVTRITRVLRVFPEIVQAFLVCQPSRALPEVPCHILGIVIDPHRLPTRAPAAEAEAEVAYASASAADKDASAAEAEPAPEAIAATPERAVIASEPYSPEQQLLLELTNSLRFLPRCRVISLHQPECNELKSTLEGIPNSLIWSDWR